MRTMNRAVLVVGVLWLGLAGTARADLMPPLNPECDGKPDGTPCDMSRGLCQTTEARGRRYTSCQHDNHQCDRLGLGAVCATSPISHCQEFHGDRGDTWRACQDDAIAAATVPAPVEHSGPEANEPPDSPPAAESQASDDGCSVGSSARTSFASFVMLVMLAATLVLRARARR